MACVFVGKLKLSEFNTNGGFQLLGGTILQIPYCSASALILDIYSKGSLNSSSLG
uniref:Lysine-specific demethylase 5B isoform X2 n=1 Tax=Rhizophora mucronata TaxID=61149 RepID=A0A2P2MIT9_RHIMU